MAVQGAAIQIDAEDVYPLVWRWETRLERSAATEA